MSHSEREYWEGAAQEFDTFYKKDKDFLRRAIDQTFRKGMKDRIILTLQECRNIRGKSVLDIGCGSGRIAVELAKKGARVVGLDISEKMLKIASSMASKSRVEENCDFVHGNFATHDFSEKFDITLALGFFDYTEDPRPHLQKMSSLTREKALMSFPAKFAFQVPIRMIWLRSRNQPVYFYIKKELTQLLSQQFARFKIEDISAGYFCVAYV